MSTDIVSSFSLTQFASRPVSDKSEPEQLASGQWVSVSEQQTSAGDQISANPAESVSQAVGVCITSSEYFTGKRGYTSGWGRGWFITRKCGRFVKHKRHTH